MWLAEPDSVVDLVNVRVCVRVVMILACYWIDAAFADRLVW